MTEQSFSAGLGTGLGAALTPSAGHWQQRCFRAMNTAVEVVAYHDGEDVTAAIEALFHQAEQRMSRFLPDSELSRLNAADAPQTVSPDLFAVIETTLWAAQQTGGLYDPHHPRRPGSRRLRPLVRVCRDAQWLFVECISRCTWRGGATPDKLRRHRA
ncbi:MAG: hypothetical protein BroJett021_16210 [Chloroflexota bacterium]|nr:MAG: hypothetical protein BroJett021_16210 [Chloroflexota bacterium]